MVIEVKWVQIKILTRQSLTEYDLPDEGYCLQGTPEQFWRQRLLCPILQLVRPGRFQRSPRELEWRKGLSDPFARSTMLLASLEACRTQCLHPMKERSLEGTLLLVGRSYGGNEQSRKPVENLKLFARGLGMRLSVK